MCGVTVLRHTTVFVTVLPCYKSTLLITYKKQTPYVDGTCDGTVLRTFRMRARLRVRGPEALIKAQNKT